jgi:CDP-diacylglycerol--glycerol-3-phosphate 3-phosphatidyltransferase
VDCSQIFTIPNALTACRIVLAPLVLYFSKTQQYGIALFVFWLSSLTDFFDGFIARFFACESEIGKLLDPIADKILTFCAYLAMRHEFPKLFWLVIYRDVAILSAIVFLLLLKVQVTIAPSIAGKINTLFVLLFPFLWLCWKTTRFDFLNTILQYTSYVIVVMTVISTLSYVRIFISILRDRYS